MNKLLGEKNIVVTGTNRGLGNAILKHLAKETSGTVFACARKRQEDSLFEAELCELAKTSGCTIIPLYFDMNDSAAMKDAVKHMHSVAGTVDVLVNNAGILSQYRRFTMMPIKEVRELFDVDFFAQMEFTQLVSRLMLRGERSDKSICYISSIAAMDAFFSSYDYVACKAAINGAMLQQAREFGESGIRVNAIAPGLVNTDMIKDNDQDNLNSIIPAIMLRRFGEKDEIAKAVLFMVSEMSSYITGQVLRVDGGTNPPRSNW